MKTSLRKLAAGPLLPVGIAALYCLVIGFGVYVIDYHPRGAIQNFLLNNITWILRLNFLLLILGAVACGRDIAAAFRGLIRPSGAGGRPEIPASNPGNEDDGRCSPVIGAGAAGGPEQWAAAANAATDCSSAAPTKAPAASAAAPVVATDTAAPKGASTVPGGGGNPAPVIAAISSARPAAWLRRHFRLLILAALLSAAAVAVTSVAPRVHRIYYDEDIYGNVAQGMALRGQAAMCNYGVFEYDEYHPHWQIYNKEPSGWPFLVSMAFQIGGVDEEHGFRMNNLLYLGGILVCFWIVHVVTGRFFPAIIGALVWGTIPQNLVWSNTMAAEPAAAFFGGLAVLCLLVYLKTGRLRHLALLCLVVPLASQMRPESGLIGLWAFLALLVATPRRLTRWEVWLLGLPALVFLLPQFLHIYAVSGESWGAEGAKFSLEFFFKNIAVNGPYYLNNQLFPAVFTFLALIGLVGPLQNRGRGRWEEEGRNGLEQRENAAGKADDPPMKKPVDEDDDAVAAAAGATTAPPVATASQAPSAATAAPATAAATSAAPATDTAEHPAAAALQACPEGAAGTGHVAVAGSSDLYRSQGGERVTIGDEKGKGGGWPGAGIRRLALPGLFLLWFVMFWGIFLFFYAGSYKYGADVRFALLTFMPLAVLAGMGADRLRAGIAWIAARLTARRPLTTRDAEGPMWPPQVLSSRRKDGRTANASASAPTPAPPTASSSSGPSLPASSSLPLSASRFGSPPLSGDAAGRSFRTGGVLAAGLIFVLLLYSWLPFLPLVRLVSQEAWGARYDHAYAKQFIEKIPRRSVVLTHVPTMMLLWQQGAIQTFAGINNPDIITELLKRYDGHVYFYHNYWCSTTGHHKDLCTMMREKYELTEIATAQEQHVHYGLYRIRFKDKSPVEGQKRQF